MEIDESTADEGGLNTIIRAVALVLAAVLVGLGIWALGGAIYSGWGLFRDPDGIGYFARYFLETTKLAELVPKGAAVGLAHYVSWVAVILLLLVLGKLGAWAIEAGARLLVVRQRRTHG